MKWWWALQCFLVFMVAGELSIFFINGFLGDGWNLLRINLALLFAIWAYYRMEERAWERERRDLENHIKALRAHIASFSRGLWWS